MDMTRGTSEIKIGLIDGPVDIKHPDLNIGNIREVPGRFAGACSRSNSVACRHGTLVAGILIAKRGSAAPAICPGCTLLVRPIFEETTSRDGDMPSATPEELAQAIIDTVDAGSNVINLSSALAQVSSKGERQLDEALTYAAHRGVICVAAAGNQGMLGSTAITRHTWVISVAACDSGGRPLGKTNLGRSIGTRGLLAPGDNITSLGLGSNGEFSSFGGTSAAAPFVTGTMALLWSAFPNATAARLKLAMTDAHRKGSAAIVPSLLNAWAAYQSMAGCMTKLPLQV
jgi:subtilisin family serine protease